MKTYTKKSKAIILITSIITVLTLVICVLLVCAPGLFLGKAKVNEKQYQDRLLCFYSEAELASDPTKSETWILPFIVKKNAPFAIIAGGGGYGYVSTDLEGVQYAKVINKMGYNAFVLKYRTGENAKQPNPMEDMAAAVKYIFENAEKLGVSTDGYAVIGSSAGGHLVASFGTKAVGYLKYGIQKPKTLILCYPVITMDDYTHFGSRENLLREDENDQALRELYSVEKQIDSDYPNTFVWWCKDDIIVSPRNSKTLVSKLSEFNVRYEKREYFTGGHGCGLGTTGLMKGWLKEAVRFWQEEK